MSTTYSYPKQYELLEVLSSITNRKFLVEFAQKRGLFITNATQTEIAKELSILYYDENDLEEIRAEAYQNNASHTLNGFEVQGARRTFNLASAYEAIRENSIVAKDMVFSSLHEMSSKPGAEIYKGEIQYKKNKVGRIQFLQHEEASFEFYFFNTGNGNWRVEVDAARPTDFKELFSLLNRQLNNDTEFTVIDPNKFNAEKSIAFFDELATNGLDKSWQCIDVTHVIIKKGDDKVETSDNEDEEYDEISVEASKTETIEIRKAILEGQNIRDNDFVNQFINAGYRFAAMTFEFEKKKKPDVVQIRAEFKDKPKVFEVSIKSYEHKTSLAAVRKSFSITSDEDRLLRSQFWNNAKTIYKKL